MRLNTSTGYAVQIMPYLAKNRRIVSTSELGKSVSVSTRYLAQIAATLRDGGLIEASVGSLGGYRLAKDAGQISVFDIVLLMEGPVEVSNPANANAGNNDVLSYAYGELEAYINSYLKMMTLEGLTRKSCDEWREAVVNMVNDYVKTRFTSPL